MPLCTVFLHPIVKVDREPLQQGGRQTVQIKGQVKVLAEVKGNTTEWWQLVC